MSANRVFYLIQGSLQICEPGRSAVSQVFVDSDDGLRAFDSYLAANARQTSLMLVDVIEEVFTTDTIPNLGMSDRKALLDRRLQRKFPRTPYKQAVVSQRKLLQAHDQSVVLSSISNHELVDPWLAAIMRHQVPLTGIFSVPLMAAKTLRRLYRPTGPTLFITQHQRDRLRQVFVDSELVKSARLSRSPAIDDEAYPGFVITEIQRSRRYLERSRLLSGIEQMDVCMIAPRDVSRRILETAELDSPIQFHFLEPKSAAKKLHADKNIAADRLEELYVVSSLRSRPSNNYATTGETRYWHMSRIRQAIIGTTITVAATCSVFAGIYLGDAWRLRNEAQHINAQVTQLSETYRRENENFAPIRANSYEMKLAVDTGDYILQQRIPVPWVMQQLGSVLGDYPDVQVTELSWESETTGTAPAVRTRAGEKPAPVPIPAIDAVTIELSGRIEPFGGDMRKAFARIDGLVADIASRTSFIDAWAVEYPIDASLHSTVSGEISKATSNREAKFRLRLSYPITTTVKDGVGDDAA